MSRILLYITCLLAVASAIPAGAQGFEALVAQNMDATLIITGTVSATGAPTQSSGCCIDPSGWVLATSHQVVGVENLEGRLRDGTTFPLRVVEALDDRELALLKTDRPLPTAVSIGRAGKLLPGTQVFSIATPMQLDFSVARGDISNTNRTWRGHWVIQADFRVNSGSSGGPIFDNRGQLVGSVYGIMKDYGWTIMLPVENAFPMLRRNGINVPPAELDGMTENLVVAAKGISKLERDALEAYNRGVAARDPRDKAAAYQTAANLLRDFYEAHFNLAVALTATGELPKAASAYERAAVLRPNALESRRNLGMLYLRTEELDKAIAAFKSAQAVAPSQPQSYNDLGEAYRRAGQLEMAREQYLRAIELNDDYASAHYNLALVLVGLRAPADAITHLERYLELTPAALDAANVRAYIEELKTQP